MSRAQNDDGDRESNEAKGKASDQVVQGRDALVVVTQDVGKGHVFSGTVDGCEDER